MMRCSYCIFSACQCNVFFAVLVSEPVYYAHLGLQGSDDGQNRQCGVLEATKLSRHASAEYVLVFHVKVRLYQRYSDQTQTLRFNY